MKVRTPADVGLLLREQRKRLGLDQGELAEHVGVSRQWIIEIEKGKSGAELGLVLRTAQALGLALDVSVAGEASGSPAMKAKRGAEPKRRQPALPAIDLDELINRLGRPPTKSKR